MTNDLQLLMDFRSEVAPPDEATAQRIYRLATSGRLRERGLSAPRTPLPPLRLPRLARRRLIALSAAGVAALSLAGVLVALTLTAPAPASAYAAAAKAVAATSAGTLPSGTLTLDSTGPDTSSPDSSVTTVRWYGKDIAIEGQMLPGFVQLRRVAEDVYLRRADGDWLHFASDADLATSPYAGAVRFAYSLAVGSQAAQIIASAYGLQKTVQPDGSTTYTGTIPPRSPAEVAPSKDPARAILPSFGPGGAFQMIVGRDGLVTQMSETASPPLTASWSLKYSRLGSTPPITSPATYTEGTPGDLPTHPHQVSSGSAH